MSAANGNSIDSLVGLSGFRCIVADPPWDYKPKRGGNSYAKRKGWYYAGGVKESPLPYQCMSTEDICRLPIADCADRDGCRLFCWATNAHLHDALHVVEAWGFRYAQTLVWHKTNASPFSGSVAFGSAEFLLVAVRGKVPILSKARSSVVSLGHHHNHSQKPEAFQDLVMATTPGPYLELFARRPRLGWVTIGNEADGMDVKDSLSLLAQGKHPCYGVEKHGESRHEQDV